jgi:hypothetical protein
MALSVVECFSGGAGLINEVPKVSCLASENVSLHGMRFRQVDFIEAW